MLCRIEFYILPTGNCRVKSLFQINNNDDKKNSDVLVKLVTVKIAFIYIKQLSY